MTTKVLMDQYIEALLDYYDAMVVVSIRQLAAELKRELEDVLFAADQWSEGKHPSIEPLLHRPRHCREYEDDVSNANRKRDYTIRLIPLLRMGTAERGSDGLIRYTLDLSKVADMDEARRVLREITYNNVYSSWQFHPDLIYMSEVQCELFGIHPPVFARSVFEEVSALYQVHRR